MGTTPTEMHLGSRSKVRNLKCSWGPILIGAAHKCPSTKMSLHEAVDCIDFVETVCKRCAAQKHNAKLRILFEQIHKFRSLLRFFISTISSKAYEELRIIETITEITESNYDSVKWKQNDKQFVQARHSTFNLSTHSRKSIIPVRDSYLNDLMSLCPLLFDRLRI